jgi:hypothetical protein
MSFIVDAGIIGLIPFTDTDFSPVSTELTYTLFTLPSAVARMACFTALPALSAEAVVGAATPKPANITTLAITTPVLREGDMCLM